jgi:hypothetical protein
MGRLMTTTERSDPELGKTMRERFETIEEAYQGKLMELQAAGRKTSRARF